MPRRPAKPPRWRLNPRQALVALATVGLVAVSFALVLKVTVAGVFRDARPRAALSWNPLDARARAQLASRLMDLNPSDEAQIAAEGLSKDSLARNPLQPLALRSLAMVYARQSDSRSTRAVVPLMFEANRVSRRDQMTQLWLIDYYRRRNDMAGIVRHFDVALRTSSANRPVLFPLMATISTDPRVAVRLAEVLEREPQWAAPFAAHLIDTAQDSGHVIRIVLPILDVSVAEDLGLIRSLFQRFTHRREYDLAWRSFVATGLHDQAGTSATIRNGGFQRGDGFPPFDWILAEEENFWASREARGGERGDHLLRLAARGGSGDVARQLLRLAPGRYRLAVKAGDVDQVAAQRPRLRILCADAGSNILLSATPAAAGAGPFTFGGDFTVPTECQFQWVVVTLRSDNSTQTITPWIDDVAIAPQSRR